MEHQHLKDVPSFHAIAFGFPIFPAPFIKEAFLLHCMFWLLCEKLFAHIHVGLFLGSQFCSIGLCVCFSAVLAIVAL